MKGKSSPRWLLWLAAIVVLAADQASKAWVVQNLTPNLPTDVIPWLRPILSFTYVTNRGVAFGLLPQLGDVFTIFGILVIGAILLFQRSLQGESWLVYAALGMQIGGAAGNVLDRLFRGQVVDFIDLNFWPMQTWPISNVADVCIVAGVMILMGANLLAERQTTLASPDSPQTSDRTLSQDLEHEKLEA